jgi:xanthine dehydrogenase molybdopterin-binding subunit B
VASSPLRPIELRRHVLVEPILAAEGFYKTPFIGDVEGVHSQSRAFLYFIYACAAAEVEIDVLTGELQILRADILYDAGHSLNPCIDVGQIEGAFVQGAGLMTSEQLMYENDGRLYSTGTWDYKPPTSKSIPIDFRVTISRGGNPTKDNAAVAGSRALGEPPFVLSTSVFFAIKQAILAARRNHCKVDRARCGCDEVFPTGSARPAALILCLAGRVLPDSRALASGGAMSAARRAG